MSGANGYRMAFLSGLYKIMVNAKVMIERHKRQTYDVTDVEWLKYE